MTYKAREVLSDCKLSLEMLEMEADPNRWKVVWAGAVALVRAVGHVLDKVDGQDQNVKKASNEAFRRWKVGGPDDKIFTSFIDSERNNLLKEYRSDVYPLPSVPVAIQLELQSVSGEYKVRTAEIIELDENLFRPMVDGPFSGEDARDVLEAAIIWWESQLNQIDEKVNRERPGHPAPLGSNSAMPIY